MLNIDRKVYDIIGIGIGPFNLGLAALVASIPQLNCLFFDQSPEFTWHAGMMLADARLQVPFYADLVTIIDPCSPFTYLNFLKHTKRLFRFAIHENNFVTRREYNAYCKWVVEQLDTLRFHHKVVDVHYEPKEEQFTVMIHNLSSDTVSFYYAKHLVVGVGTVPSIPDCARSFDKLRMTKCERIIHSSEYLFHKDNILEQSNITIVGSGQSAAEIFYDLLDYSDHLESLCWFTRSARFYPMEYSKLSLEMTSPDYIEHFYGLPNHKKKEVLKKQDPLYRGINFGLINEIYDSLYLKSLSENIDHIRLYPNCELLSVQTETDILLQFEHLENEQCFGHQTKALILATGYKPCVPEFLSSLGDLIQQDEDGNCEVKRDYSIDNSGKVFVQNAELHSHGFSAPDLGMGPYRNATILNTIMGHEHFVMEKNIAFQKFDIF